MEALQVQVISLILQAGFCGLCVFILMGQRDERKTFAEKIGDKLDALGGEIRAMTIAFAKHRIRNKENGDS